MIHLAAATAMIVSLCASIAIGAEEAGLTWSSRVAAVEAEMGAEKVNGSFTFTNAGEEPVTILSVLTGCGCTVAKLEKKTYAPGEAGRLDVTFAPEGKGGTHTKYITVRSAPAPGSAPGNTPGGD